MNITMYNVPYWFAITIFTLLCQIRKLISSECQTGIIPDQSDPKNEKCHSHDVASLHCKPICETGLTLQGLDALAFLLFACTNTTTEGSRPKKDLFCVQLSEMRSVWLLSRRSLLNHNQTGTAHNVLDSEKNGTLGKSHCVPQLA